MLFLIYPQILLGQDSDGPLITSKKLMWSQFFWGSAISGFNAGVTNGYEQGTYSLGGEMKMYGSYYGLSGYSTYLNYKRFIVQEKEFVPSQSLAVGVHVLLVGLESSLYFGNDTFGWNIIPKLGMDWGMIGFFYGYQLPLRRDGFFQISGHIFEIKYHLNFEAFKYHKMRVRYNQGEK